MTAPLPPCPAVRDTFACELVKDHWGAHAGTVSQHSTGPDVLVLWVDDGPRVHADLALDWWDGADDEL